MTEANFVNNQSLILRSWISRMSFDNFLLTTYSLLINIVQGDHVIDRPSIN